MRIRTVKPDFWDDEIVALLSRDARLLFIGTWNLADDEGRLRWTPEYIKACLFKYDDDLGVAAVAKLMAEITDADLVKAYIGGRAHQRLAHVVRFGKHQRINRPQQSRLPTPPWHADSLNGSVNSSVSDAVSHSVNESVNDAQPASRNESVNDSMNGSVSPAPLHSVNGSVTNSLLEVEGEVEEEVEVEGVQGETARPPRKTRGSRLPENWEPTDLDIEWLRKEGITVAQATRSTAKFRDHWRAAAGQNASKLDWSAAWKNWLRTDVERTRPRESDAPSYTPWGGA